MTEADFERNPTERTWAPCINTVSLAEDVNTKKKNPTTTNPWNVCKNSQPDDCASPACIQTTDPFGREKCLGNSCYNVDNSAWSKACNKHYKHIGAPCDVFPSKATLICSNLTKDECRSVETSFVGGPSLYNETDGAIAALCRWDYDANVCKACTAPAATVKVTSKVTVAPAVDCVVEWSEGTCNASTGTQTKTGTIITPSSGGGKACPTVLSTTQPCPVDCVESMKSPSECTAVGQDLYTLTTQARNGGKACTGSPTLCKEGDGRLTKIDCAYTATCPRGACGLGLLQKQNSVNITHFPSNGGMFCPSLSLGASPCRSGKDVIEDGGGTFSGARSTCTEQQCLDFGDWDMVSQGSCENPRYFRVNASLLQDMEKQLNNNMIAETAQLRDKYKTEIQANTILNPETPTSFKLYDNYKECQRKTQSECNTTQCAWNGVECTLNIQGCLHTKAPLCLEDMDYPPLYIIPDEPKTADSGQSLLDVYVDYYCPEFTSMREDHK